MKRLLLFLCLGTILNTHAQSIYNLASRTYDTTLTSNGFNVFNLNFPRWSPDSGLLVSVVLTSEISSQYGFTLKNMDVQPATYQLTIGQQDQFISPQLLAPLTHFAAPRLVGSYPLAPGETTVQGPFTFLDKQSATDSVTAVGNFLGAGSISISYMSFTFSSLSTINNASYAYGATVNNNMHFSLKYYYVKADILLAEGLTHWDAQVKGASTALLDWSAVNETAGRRYNVQRSNDGRQFSTVASISASAAPGAGGNYTYTDLLPAGQTDFYYRLEIVDDASTTYSPVRHITLDGSKKSLKIYPNPATSFINLAPPTAETSSWQVDILSSAGTLVQRETSAQTPVIHVDFRAKMSAGTYFVRAVDLRGHKVYTGSFMVIGEK
ncbi:MAG: T9SS type A sorting domain-containing protein [Bacteroidetes bacterium]|nr:T9SS type A sorting domain-containing protein [Bacteroidota bacterium]